MTRPIGLNVVVSASSWKLPFLLHFSSLIIQNYFSTVLPSLCHLSSTVEAHLYQALILLEDANPILYRHYQTTLQPKKGNNHLASTTIPTTRLPYNPDSTAVTLRLDALWDFKGAPNTSRQEYAMIHRKVHAKADLAPTHPGWVHNLPPLLVKTSAQTAVATSSHNNIVCSYISQKSDVQI